MRRLAPLLPAKHFYVVWYPNPKRCLNDWRQSRQEVMLIVSGYSDGKQTLKNEWLDCGELRYYRTSPWARKEFNPYFGYLVCRISVETLCDEYYLSNYDGGNVQNSERYLTVNKNFGSESFNICWRDRPWNLSYCPWWSLSTAQAAILSQEDSTQWQWAHCEYVSRPHTF